MVLTEVVVPESGGGTEVRGKRGDEVVAAFIKADCEGGPTGVGPGGGTFGLATGVAVVVLPDGGKRGVGGIIGGGIGGTTPVGCWPIPNI